MIAVVHLHSNHSLSILTISVFWKDNTEESNITLKKDKNITYEFSRAGSIGAAGAAMAAPLFGIYKWQHLQA